MIFTTEQTVLRCMADECQSGHKVSYFTALTTMVTRLELFLYRHRHAQLCNMSCYMILQVRLAPQVPPCWQLRLETLTHCSLITSDILWSEMRQRKDSLRSILTQELSPSNQTSLLSRILYTGDHFYNVYPHTRDRDCIKYIWSLTSLYILV